MAEDTGAYSHDERMQAAAKGEALPDGSYPTRNCDELHKAVEAYGRETGSKEVLRRYLIRRAIALGCTNELPDDWDVNE